MIESLKDDAIFAKLGGKFKFTALAQRRMKELMDGARPLVERRGRSDFEIAVQEIAEGKIALELDGEENREIAQAVGNALAAADQDASK